ALALKRAGIAAMVDDQFSSSDPIYARDLGSRVSTIKMRVRQIMSKFGVANRTQVVIMATTRGNIASCRLGFAMP
ncbi:hypothetical protein, partial [Klebsiella pneumoniae]|uniref:hypothetical protein n=1 Tax=Klebsiella pneumoniae TaxID=573 RepID=UPI003D6AC12C